MKKDTKTVIITLALIIFLSLFQVALAAYWPESSSGTPQYAEETQSEEQPVVRDASAEETLHSETLADAGSGGVTGNGSGYPWAYA